MKSSPVLTKGSAESNARLMDKLMDKHQVYRSGLLG